MHPVLESLKSRKGKAAPFNDGKKIALVVFGGMMTGVRGAGAMIALSELGFENCFDDIYSISSGFANASYFLSGQRRMGASIYYEDLSGVKFLKPWKFWRMADIDHMISVMSKEKALDIGKIMKNSTRLHARLWDRHEKKIKYIEIHQIKPEEYMNLMKASTSVRFFHGGKTKIGENYYSDPDFRHNQAHQHLNHAMASGATDIIAIYNNQRQYEHPRKEGFSCPANMFEFFPRQDWKMGRLETRASRLKSAAMRMGELVKSEFGIKAGVRLK